MAEQHVLVGRHVVQAIVVDHRRVAGSIQLHHLVGDEQAVEAVGDQVQRNRGDDDPQRIDVRRGSATVPRQNAPSRASTAQPSFENPS